MTIAVPVCKCDHSSTISRLSKTCRLNISTDHATEVVKEEDMLEVKKVAESSHLSPEGVAAQDALLQAIRTVYCVYTEDIGNPHKMHELQRGEDLGESIESLPINPLYNVRRPQVIQNSDYDLFNAKDMDEFGDFLKCFKS